MDDLFSFKGVQDAVTGMFMLMNNWASDVDGRLAFIAGAVSWFLVEQSLKWVQDNVLKFIMFSALVATGIGLVTIITANEQPVPGIPDSTPASPRPTS
jgi:hypothetical protein